MKHLELLNVVTQVKHMLCSEGIIWRMGSLEVSDVRVITTETKLAVSNGYHWLRYHRLRYHRLSFCGWVRAMETGETNLDHGPVTWSERD